MKSIGSMIVLVIIASLANTTWCGAQNPAAHSNQAATSRSPIFIEVEVRFIELSQEDLGQLGDEWMIYSKTETTNSRSNAGKSMQTGFFKSC
ncbi:MAG: hypothetical protein WC381_09565 [Kiritimatiellia bacterium]